MLHPNSKYMAALGAYNVKSFTYKLINTCMSTPTHKHTHHIHEHAHALTHARTHKHVVVRNSY